jgi:hypothetical protein
MKMLLPPNFLAVSVAALTAFLVTISVSPAVANGHEGHRLPDLANATADSRIALAQERSPGGPILLQGTITRDAAPLAGAAVVARIWPSTEMLSRIPEGGSVDVKIVQLTTTNRNGTYTLRLDPELVPATHVEEDGAVSVQLWLVHEGSETPWNVSLYPPSEKNGRQSWATEKMMGDATAATDTLGVDFEVGQRPHVKQADEKFVDWIDSRGRRVGDRSSSETPDSTSALKLDGDAAIVALATSTCWASVPAGGTWYYNNRERFMSVYGWSGALASVDQSIGSSSSHTVGVAYKSNSGSWTANGTVTTSISTSAGQAVSNLTNVHVHNSINYRRWNCSEGSDNTSIVGTELRPAGFYDIFAEPHTTTNHAYYSLGCADKSPTTTVWKTSGTNQTYSAGITTPLTSLSARSGYNAGTRLSFKVTANSRICGNSSAGWLSASSVDMRSR